MSKDAADRNKRYVIAEEMMCLQLDVPRDHLITFTLDRDFTIMACRVPNLGPLSAGLRALQGSSFEAHLFTHIMPGDWPFLKATLKKHPDRYHLADLLLRVSDSYVMGMFCLLFTSAADLRRTYVIALKKHYRDAKYEARLQHHMAQFKKRIEKNGLFYHPATQLSAEDEQWLARLEYLLQYTSPVPTLRDLAHHVGLSQTDLKQKFRRLKGMTLHQYIVDLLVKKMKDMLKNPSVPLSVIAARLHYELPILTRLFQQRTTGQSPQDFRQDPDGKNVRNGNNNDEGVNG